MIHRARLRLGKVWVLQQRKPRISLQCEHTHGAPSSRLSSLIETYLLQVGYIWSDKHICMQPLSYGR